LVAVTVVFIPPLTNDYEILFLTNMVLGSAGECNSVEGDGGGEHKHH